MLEAHLTSIMDIDPADTTPFTPTAQMIAQGPAIALGLPTRFPVRAPGNRPAGLSQPVIIHATIDAEGAVRESE